MRSAAALEDRRLGEGADRQADGLADRQDSEFREVAKC